MSTTRDWDAGTYQRVSVPHEEWARSVLDRLDLRGDETVLDAGCGSGRVTALLIERLPAGRVVAVDGSPSMVESVRGVLRPDDRAILSDLTDLALPEPVDAVFSTAVFHWVLDHQELFGRLREALREGGRLAAQCGGAGNIRDFREAGRRVAAREAYAGLLADFDEPWNYASPEETEERLRAAGFREVRCWLQPWDVVPPEPHAFVKAVCLGPQVDLLPEPIRDPFVAEVIAELPAPLKLGYVRLNIDARA